MARYIDADKAINIIEIDGLQMFGYTKRDAIDCIKATPTADVQEVRHGKWGNDGGYDRCSICEYLELGRTNYCPHCGAKMEGGE